MTLKSLLSHSIEAYTAVRTDSRPADAVLSDYLRARKYLGSHDRKFISEAVYGTLRYDLAIEAFIIDALPQNSNKITYALTLFLFLSQQHHNEILSPTSELTSISEAKLLELRSQFFSRRQNPLDLSEQRRMRCWPARSTICCAMRSRAAITPPAMPPICSTIWPNTPTCAAICAPTASA